MIRITLDIAAATEALAAQSERLRDLSPGWRSVLAYMQRQTAAQFDSQGGRSGDGWEPLTARYERRKSRAFPGQPILRASDRLFRSVTTQTADAVQDIAPRVLLYGTRVPYGRYHQRGGKRLPRRQFLAVTDADRRQIAALVRAHLDGQAALNGFQRG